MRPRGNLDFIFRRSSCKWVHDLQKVRSSAVHCFCALAGGRRQRTNLRKTWSYLNKSAAKQEESAVLLRSRGVAKPHAHSPHAVGAPYRILAAVWARPTVDQAVIHNDKLVRAPGRHERRVPCGLRRGREHCLIMSVATRPHCQRLKGCASIFVLSSDSGNCLTLKYDTDLVDCVGARRAIAILTARRKCRAKHKRMPAGRHTMSSRLRLSPLTLLIAWYASVQ